MALCMITASSKSSGNCEEFKVSRNGYARLHSVFEHLIGVSPNSLNVLPWTNLVVGQVVTNGTTNYDATRDLKDTSPNYDST